MAKSEKKRQKVDESPNAGLLDWSTLIGFERDMQMLAALHQSIRLPQVILFEGREGMGKRHLMAWLAARMHCETQSACGQCAACRAIKGKSHDELLWLETDTAYKLADAQAIQEHLSLQAAGSTAFALPACRLVVVCDIERMSIRVVNRLLKTLEEPSPNSMIILSSSRPRQLLPTIRSRVVRWHLVPPAIDESVPWLKAQAESELGSEQTWDVGFLQRVLKEHGLAPGASLRALKSYASGESKQLEQVLISLLKDIATHDVLTAGKELSREQGRQVIDLANHFELLLNRYYRWCLGLHDSRDERFFQGMAKPPNLARLLKWRKLLRRLRQLTGRSKIPLNAQLAIEALGLPDTLS